MCAKKGHEIDRMMIIKLSRGNYARDLVYKFFQIAIFLYYL